MMLCNRGVLLSSFVLLLPGVAIAVLPADHPARTLPAAEVIEKHVLPNLRTEGETSNVVQETTTAGRSEERRFRRAAIDEADYKRVEIAYETGTRPIYVDTIDAGERVQEYRVAPSQPARRMTGDVTSSIGGSAFTFRDLHHEFERYRWEKEEGASGGPLYLRGEGGPYPKIVVGIEEFEGRLVVSEMRLYDPAERQIKEVALTDFVVIGGKVRARSVRLHTFGAAGKASDDGIVTTLKVDWQSIDTAPDFRLAP